MLSDYSDNEISSDENTDSFDSNDEDNNLSIKDYELKHYDDDFKYYYNNYLNNNQLYTKNYIYDLKKFIKEYRIMKNHENIIKPINTGPETKDYTKVWTYLKLVDGKLKEENITELEIKRQKQLKILKILNCARIITKFFKFVRTCKRKEIRELKLKMKKEKKKNKNKNKSRKKKKKSKKKKK